jgi:hypothetical protein
MDTARPNLSPAAKLQIQQMRRFRAHPTTHESAIADIVALIRAGEIAHLDDARAFCASDEWTEAEIASLSRTIDDVGYTLKMTGAIPRW